MRTHRTLKILVAALLGAAWAQAPAAEPDWDHWKCKWCPFPEAGTSGSVSAGAIDVSDDSARFGDYTGLNEDGVYADLDADLLYRAEGGYAVEAKARNLGVDAREVEIGAGRQGRWTAELTYDEIPRYLDDTAETVFTGAGSSGLSLPGGWVRGGSTADMTALGASLRPLDVEYDVTTTGLGLEFVQNQRLRYEADWTRQTKEGFGRTWGGFLSASATLPRPIDYETDQVDAAVIYAGDGWMVKGAYYGSFFSNKDLALSWDNPYTGPDRGRMANAPDNKYNQFILSGSFGLDFWQTRVNASYATGTMEQSDALLRYTVNPAVATRPLPRAEFDGDVDTVHGNVRIVSRPTDALRVTAEYRFDERDNQSSIDVWDIVQADTFPALAEENPLYGYQDTDTDLSLDYAFTRTIHAYAGWERRKKERDGQDVDETEEDTYWAQLRLRPAGGLAISLRAEGAERDASEYRQVSTGSGRAQNPLMRKYYLADREREAYEARLDWAGERTSLSFKYQQAEDDYTDSFVGLTDTNYDQFAADASLVVGKGLVGSLFYARDNYDSKLVGAGSATAPNTAPPNWDARTQDEQEMVGLALDWPGLLDGKLDLRADWIRAETTGDIAVGSGPGAARESFPTLKGDLDSAGLAGVWHLGPRLDLRAEVRWEQYDAEDWALDGVGPATIGNVLTFGSEPLEYDLVVLFFGVDYKFGVKEAEDD